MRGFYTRPSTDVTPNSVNVDSAQASHVGSPVPPESTSIWCVPVALLFFMVVGLSVTFFYRTAGPIQPMKLFNGIDLDMEEVRLARVLNASAMENNTVILTTVNAAWTSTGTIIDLFLKSFQIGNDTRVLLNHLVIIAFDNKAYLRCRTIHRHCFALATPGIDFSVNENYMTDGYLKMMWRRVDFLRMVLEMGYNFIFTDADIMWFRNPLPRFFHDADFQIASDYFNGNSLDRDNQANTGFTFVKSNNRTIEFYKLWYLSREKYHGLKDQDVLDKIKYDPFVDEIGLKMRFLSTEFFGGFCEPSEDFNKVCTMHANCCIGLKKKINDLTVMLEDWRSYMALPTPLKTTNVSVWRIVWNYSQKLAAEASVVKANPLVDPGLANMLLWPLV